jgi:hypothetical protein
VVFSMVFSVVISVVFSVVIGGIPDEKMRES